MVEMKESTKSTARAIKRALMFNVVCLTFLAAINIIIPCETMSSKICQLVTVAIVAGIGTWEILGKKTLNQFFECLFYDGAQAIIEELNEASNEEDKE